MQAQKNALTNQIETAANDLLSNRDGLFEAALTLNKFIAGETHKDFDGYQNISTRIDYLRIELEKTNKLLRRTAIADTFSILMPASNVLRANVIGRDYRLRTEG
ncbi:MAG: hypothetical protein IPK58_10650 [Acidobacteria bacterium]|nr:hypothetical protein [Acidobacteriota bacterium]